MTNYMSPVQKIDQMFLEPIPTDRAINVVKATRDGRVTLLLASDGRVYSNMSANVSYTLGVSDIQTSTMNALRRLGVITKAQMEEHLAAGEKRDQPRRRQWAADSIVGDAKVLGIKLTKAQQAKVDALRAPDPQANSHGAGVSDA